MAALFQNRQWKVTNYGVETRKPEAPYQFEAKQLLETTDRGNGLLYDWPVHLAEKSWVDIEAFIEVFAKALEIHKGKYAGTVDPEMLEASLAEARYEARRR